MVINLKDTYQTPNLNLIRQDNPNNLPIKFTENGRIVFTKSRGMILNLQDQKHKKWASS